MDDNAARPVRKKNIKTPKKTINVSLAAITIRTNIFG